MADHFGLSSVRPHEGLLWTVACVIAALIACADVVCALRRTQAADGTYVVGPIHGGGHAYVAFRALPDGRGAGRGSLFLSGMALALALVALVLARNARARGAALAEWQDGVIGPDGGVVPEGGGPRLHLPVGAQALPPGTRVLYRRAPVAEDYRSMANELDSVREGSSAAHARRLEMLEGRARALAVLSIVLGGAVAVRLLARGRGDGSTARMEGVTSRMEGARNPRHAARLSMERADRARDVATLTMGRATNPRHGEGPSFERAEPGSRRRISDDGRGEKSSPWREAEHGRRASKVRGGGPSPRMCRRTFGK